MKPRIRSAWYLVIAVCQSPGIEDEFDGMVAARHALTSPSGDAPVGRREAGFK